MRIFFLYIKFPQNLLVTKKVIKYFRLFLALDVINLVWKFITWSFK
jgi:hypothetical protein